MVAEHGRVGGFLDSTDNESKPTSLRILALLNEPFLRYSHRALKATNAVVLSFCEMDSFIEYRLLQS